MSETMKVYEAIASVTASLAKDGIAKSRRNQQQGYSFRGIDDVYNALAPFLAEAKLCILPRVLDRSVVERATKDGKGVLFYVTCSVEFDFVSALDGSKHTVKTYGEAMDSGDKATNKAMSAAYKYAAMQAFCIPTEGDNDADATTHEVAPPERPPNTAKQVAVDAFDALPEDEQKFLRDLAAEIDQRFRDKEELHHWLEAKRLDTEEKLALWSLLSSPIRSAIKQQRQVAALKQAA